MANGEALRIRYRDVSSLIPYAKNARTHSDAQVKQICASIEEFGWTNPVLVAPGGDIVAGHGRVLAAQQMGITRVPTIELRGLSDAQRRLYVIADNKLALNAGWDEAMLAEELSALRDTGVDVGVAGFSDDELEELLGLGAGDDDGGVPAPDGPVVSRAGDCWLLGPHRVRCGDSTDKLDVALLMGDERADCLWTDPPYNVDYEGAAGTILNDAMPDAEFAEFLFDAFSVGASVMKPGAAAYVAHSESTSEQFRSAFVRAGFKLSICLIWVKNALVLGRMDYHPRHEPILYGWKATGTHEWFGGRAQTSILELDEPTVVQSGPREYQVSLGEETLVIRGEGVTVERVMGSILLEDKPVRSDLHPTMKPVPLVERMVRNSTRRGGGGPRSVWRGRVHADRVSAVWAAGPADGAGATLRRRDDSAMVRGDRRGGDSAELRRDVRRGGGAARHDAAGSVTWLA